jgi:hypothetical protein
VKKNTTRYPICFPHPEQCDKEHEPDRSVFVAKSEFRELLLQPPRKGNSAVGEQSTTRCGIPDYAPPSFDGAK